jgi:hypothetical protein
MKLTVSTKNVKDHVGIVYLLQIRLEEKELVKIGVTSRDKIEDRVCEILTGIWKKYRIFPECYVKRYRKTDRIFEKESYLHRQFREHRYIPEHVFSGSTELFLVPIEDVVVAYDELLAGVYKSEE